MIKLSTKRSEITSSTLKHETPFYFFNLAKIETNLIRLRKYWLSHFKQVEIAYSFKTNSNEFIIDQLRQLKCNAEVVSLKELKLAKRLNFDGNRIYFNGPLKTKEELFFASRHRVIINCDSMEELKLIVRHKLTNLKLGLRVSHYLRKQESSRFGFSKNEIISAIAFANENGVRIHGIHMHMGSSIQNLKLYDLNIRLAVDCLIRISNMWDGPFYLDLGGGFKTFDKNISYFPKIVHRHLVKAELINRTKVVLEPGRFIVENTGFIVSKVVSVKSRSSETVVILDIGKHMVNANESHNVIPIGKGMTLRNSRDVFFTGYNCYETDFIFQMKLRVLPRYIVIDNIGAYDFSNLTEWIRSKPQVYFKR